MIADVQRVIGDQELPAQVLGALARRGSQHAIDVLTANLNDERAWVRQWSLAGFASIPPMQRLAALRGAEPSLKFADTREAVRRAIAASGGSR